MNFILDNEETEKKYQQILGLIKSYKSGEVADLMSRQGISYKLNWGVSLVELRDIAKTFEPDHLLALKLWNKQWRETMILATLLDEPSKVTEEQMDFWTKSFGNTEIAEITSTHLWVKSKFAFIKALEWCRGKKNLVHYTGIHLAGRLAISEKKALDEMFESFFEEFLTLAKDPKLFTVLYRSIISIACRSEALRQQCIELTETMQLSESENEMRLGETLFEELNSNYFNDSVNNK